MLEAAAAPWGKSDSGFHPADLHTQAASSLSIHRHGLGPAVPPVPRAFSTQSLFSASIKIRFALLLWWQAVELLLLELLLVSVEDSARPAYEREGELSWYFLQFFKERRVSMEQSYRGGDGARPSDCFVLKPRLPL